MDKIIKHGFRLIKNDRIRGQNDTKGKMLFQSGHVLQVVERENAETKEVSITCKVIAQTSVSNLYDVKIMLDNNRNISNAECSCKAGQSGKCKHICALVHFINSPDSAITKTSFLQQWGKPSHKQMLGYDKGARMEDLFPPQIMWDKINGLKPLVLSKTLLGEELAHSPLYKILEVAEKSETEIIAAESLVSIRQKTEKKSLEVKVEKLMIDIFFLQYTSTVFSNEYLVQKDVFDFYEQEVMCDVGRGLRICIETIDQSKNAEWFKQRKLRLTASNGHKIKGSRFNIEKVINDFLNPQPSKTSAMTYGKKNEKRALQEYCKLINTGEVIEVGLIVHLRQPWLSCSPDGILVYGPNIWEKRVIEIKCPHSCKDVPIFDEDSLMLNVKYLEFDENGVQLKKNCTIYTQIQLQMYVTSLMFCDLFVYSPKGSVLILIRRDDIFLAKIIPHIEEFYFTHLTKIYTMNL